MLYLARLPVLLALTLLETCGSDESLSSFAGVGSRWTLEEIDDAPLGDRVRMEFPGARKIEVITPCATFKAGIAVPYPWFAVARPRQETQPCASSADSDDALESLSRMTLAEVAGEVLILSDESGHQMVFSKDLPSE